MELLITMFITLLAIILSVVNLNPFWLLLIFIRFYEVHTSDKIII